MEQRDFIVEYNKSINKINDLKKKTRRKNSRKNCI